MQKPVIALLTDFGTTSHYVGLMKGVISGICPKANIIDLWHNIEPQNIRQAAFILKTSYSYFPEGTVFCCVVDPGVGSERKVLVLKSDKYFFVFPDNGLLDYVLQDNDENTLLIPSNKYNLESISCTFHGRDIFAPVAANIANGEKISGNNVNQDDIVHLEKLKEIISKNKITGEIIFADKFGNLITSISKDSISKISESDEICNTNIKIRIGDVMINKLSLTYSDVNIGDYIAYIGSANYLEIGIRNGNANKEIGVCNAVEIEIV